MTTGELRVLKAVQDRNQNEGSTYLWLGTIAHDTGLSTSDVKDILEMLASQNMVSVEPVSGSFPDAKVMLRFLGKQALGGADMTPIQPPTTNNTSNNIQLQNEKKAMAVYASPTKSLYKINAGKIHREGYDPITVTPTMLSILNLLLAKNPLPIKETHSKQIGSPWHGVYKDSFFGKVQRRINEMSNKKLSLIGLEAKATRQEITIFSTDSI